MNRLKQGFTLIELIVVIAVIGVLSTVAVVGLTRFQADTRDAKRASSVTVITEALEKYYDANGEYPSCGAVTATAATVVNTPLNGVSTAALVAPQAPTGTTNSLKCETLSLSGTDIFEYSGDSSVACTGSVACLGYTIKYKDEANGTIKSVTSRRNTSIATAGTPAIATASVNYTSADLYWSGVAGSTSYTLQRATNASFSSGLVEISQAGLTYTSSGLTAGTTYYYRVKGVVTSPPSETAWSNTLSITTLTVNAPSITAIANSNGTVTVSWASVANATQYTAETSLSSSFTSPTTVSGITGTSHTFSSLSSGTVYYFRVLASNASATSAWSSTSNATTIVAQPTCSTSTLNSNTQITPAWGAVTGATSYILEYATNSGFTGLTAVSGITSTSYAVSGLSNGTTYYFRVKAVNGSAQSTAGNCPSQTTGISGPTNVGWSVEGYAVRNSANVTWMPGAYPGGGNWWTNGLNVSGTCSPGATVQVRIYSYYAYSNGTGANDATLLEWTDGNQQRFVVGGEGSWYVWWQAWVACRVGGTRVGDTYLGNWGPH